MTRLAPFLETRLERLLAGFAVACFAIGALCYIAAVVVWLVWE